MKLLKYEEYNSRTYEIFDNLAIQLRKILPAARIEHVGSSSVTGSLSKGDLDVFVGVDKDQHVESIELIKSIGFIEKKDTFRSDELCMLITDQFNYDVAIQVVANGSEFEDFIKFRNILRENNDLVASYNKVKLSAEDLSDDEYRSKKASFIKNVLSGPFIRHAKLGDELSIHEAHMRSIREICVKDHGEEEIQGWGYRSLGDNWTLAIQNDFVQVVEYQNKIHGVGYFRVLDREGEKFGYIHALYFCPEIVGKGFAKRIMLNMLAFAKNRNLKYIKLESSITAHEFYIYFGFEDNGEKRKVEIGGFPVTCFPMIYCIE